MNTRTIRLGIAVVVAGGAVATAGGLAYAGSLPGAAQGVAGTMLTAAGVTVPGPDQHAGTHPDVRGQSSPTTPTAPAEPAAPAVETNTPVASAGIAPAAVPPTAVK